MNVETLLSSIRVERVLAGLAALHGLSRHPTGEPGIQRLAYSAGDIAAREWFRSEAEAAGLIVETDAIGNIFAWSDAPSTSQPAVAVGSHLDSVPGGGNYDGALGVLCALEAVRSVMAIGARRRVPLVVIAFAAEESIGFRTGCIGSRALVGELDEEHLRALTDNDGRALPEVVRQAGLAAERLSTVRRNTGWAKAFLEVHIDQGPELRDAGVPLGIVTAIAAPLRHRVTLIGETMHSGAAMMDQRRDALAGAAELILAVERVGHSHAADGLVATVGQIDVQPGLMTAVPGMAQLGTDVRAPLKRLLWEAWKEIWSEAEQMGKRRQLSLAAELLWESAPVEVSPLMLTTLIEACRLLGIPFRRMVSGSGHDAMYLARQMDIGMLFVRNQGGVSHNPAEECTPGDIAAALPVLTQALWSLATA